MEPESFERDQTSTLTGPAFWGCLLALMAGAALSLALTVPSGERAEAGQLQPDPTESPAERLAEPTLPADPSVADHGAQDYWLRCMACHGDRGQGLTDEFRRLYPPDHQNCWTSGCHGDRPYQDGFTLPESVPPVIGPQALTSFEDAQTLSTYVRAAMPWQEPGSLSGQEYDRIVVFLLRENGMDVDQALGGTDGDGEEGRDQSEQEAMNRLPPGFGHSRSITPIVLGILVLVLVSALIVSRLLLED